MRTIRVLIVDDSVVVRQLVSKVLSEDPAIQVAGSAATGRIALSRLPQVNPDLMILDVEMPDMNGLQTLVELRKTHPHLPVIMFSTLTERGAAVTLEALSLGATDYVTKPMGAGSMTVAMQRVRDELVPRIKAFCGRVRKDPGEAFPPRPPASTSLRRGPALSEQPRARIDLLAIGVSTGGPNALAILLSRLPANLPVPVVIVQHMPPIFTKLLAERLTTVSAIPVSEGMAGVALRPGQAWIAPGNFHMVVVRDGDEAKLWLHQGMAENSCRPAVDPLFRSVAEIYGTHGLGVVMTGMGQDGLRGCEDIRHAGGQVLVQDEATSVVWGMPGNVAQAGLANKVLPLPGMGPEIIRRVAEGRGPWREQTRGAEMNGRVP